MRGAANYIRQEVFVVAEAENRSTHKVYEKDKIGEVQIADEVVAIIAGLAATEVEGVASMAGNITNELVGKLGMKNLSKGVKVEVTEEHVSVDLSCISGSDITSPRSARRYRTRCARPSRI